MSATSNAAADTAAAISPTIQSKARWRVASVQPLAGYKLYVTFVDGVAGQVDMADLLTSSSAGVFAPLRDERVFRQVDVHWGAVTWPGELDLAPDAMYDEIKATGVCRVRPFEA